MNNTNPKPQIPNLAIAILAAGKGKRMNNPNKAKVMFELKNKPMIGYVVETAKKLSPRKIILIVGWQKDSVIEYVSSIQKEIIFTEQKEQLGTGHAIMQIENPLQDFSGNVLVLSGDVPLLSISTLQTLPPCSESHPTVRYGEGERRKEADNFGFAKGHS